MKSKLAALLLTIGFGSACWSQEAPKKGVPPECTKMVRVHGTFPKGPFKPLANEKYRQSPAVKFKIEEDGTVKNVILTRHTGVADIDKKVVDAARHWKYKPRPTGCGQIESEMSVLIHWSTPG